ncbi:MAG: FtsX-like permease family protein [Flavisolibacter sp.]
MVKSYLKIAFRNLRKQKIFSFINLFGLTIGLGCFLIVALYLFDELTYDGFHKKADSIFRIVETKTSAEGKESKVVSVAANIATSSKKELPQVADATRFGMLGRSNILNAENDKVFYESYYLADASFFNIFDFPVVDGDVKTALATPYSVVLTDETALKIFGQKEAAGKIIMTDRDSIPYKVTAVISIPDNSHLKFNLLFSEATIFSNQNFREFMSSDWSSNSFVTYLLLKNKKPEETSSAINQLVKRNRKPDETGGKSSFALQPLKDIHFYSAGMEGNTDSPGNIMHIYVFGIVAFFVLLIACMNYMNLTTARFAGRSKEIAVRKVAGASRLHLVRQFLTEASVLTVIALILSLGIVKLVLPRFNAFSQKHLNLGWNTDYRIWLGIVLTTLLVGLLSGLYPAFFQSKLKPYLLLKNKINIGKGNLSVRRVLVVFQFSLSIIMIIATIVVYQQLKYVNTTDLGFNKDQLLVVDINSGKVRRSAETIKTEFSKIPAVKSVSVTSRVPGEWKIIPKVKVRMPGKFTTEGEDVYFMAIDDQFLQTFQVKLLNGRNFSSASISDSSSVILNEAAAKMLGVKEPAEQPIEIPSVAFSGNASALQNPFHGRVIGIVKDFNFQSLRDKVAPMVLAYQKNPVHNIDYFTSKIVTSDVAGTLKAMEKVLRSVDDSHLFEYNFLDKQWDLFYQEDEKRQTIFLGVALMTILIASLGLFGLATYAAEQRIKEIGIRKVLGASVSGIVGMLSKDFAGLVVIASVIAFPVAWLVMNNWLKDFAFRIHIQWWVFLVAGMAALSIALITVSFQTIRAAMANPVKNLRNE